MLRMRTRLCRQPLAVVAAAAPPTAAAPPPPPSDAPARSDERGHRLEAMIQLRKLYRNLLRAEGLLQHPSPVYEAPAEPGTTKKSVGGASAAAGAAASSSSEGDEEPEPAAITAAEAEAARRLEQAVEVVAEMELTAEQLKAGLRALRACPYDFPQLFKKEAQPEAAAQLDSSVAALFEELTARAAQEIATLPFATESAAQAAIDARNARYRLSIPWAPAGAGEGASDDEGQSPAGAAAGAAAGLGERLSKAEKAAEYFVARRLQPAVQRVKETSPEGVVEGLKTSECLAGSWAWAGCGPLAATWRMLPCTERQPGRPRSSATPLWGGPLASRVKSPAQPALWSFRARSPRLAAAVSPCRCCLGQGPVESPERLPRPAAGQGCTLWPAAAGGHRGAAQAAHAAAQPAAGCAGEEAAGGATFFLVLSLFWAASGWDEPGCQAGPGMSWHRKKNVQIACADLHACLMVWPGLRAPHSVLCPLLGCCRRPARLGRAGCARRGCRAAPAWPRSCERWTTTSPPCQRRSR